MSRPPRASTRRSTFHALGRRYRVSPRPPVVFAPARGPRVPASRTESPMRRYRHRPPSARRTEHRTIDPTNLPLPTVHRRRVRTGRSSQTRINGSERPAPRPPHLPKQLRALRRTIRAFRPKSVRLGWPATGHSLDTADSPLEWTAHLPRQTDRGGHELHRRPKPPTKPDHPSSSSHTAGIACDTHRSRADSALCFPKDASCLRAAVELSDTSHGVRCLSTKSASRIVVSDCLPDTFRSQGFSPSQRLHPLDASWLCFTPHPSTGFRPSELFPRDQP